MGDKDKKVEKVEEIDFGAFSGPGLIREADADEPEEALEEPAELETNGGAEAPMAEADEGEDDETDPEVLEQDIEAALAGLDKEIDRLESGGAIRPVKLAVTLGLVRDALDAIYTLQGLDDGDADEDEETPQLTGGDEAAKSGQHRFSRDEIHGIQGVINGAFSVLLALQSIYGKQFGKFLKTLPRPEGSKQSDPHPGELLGQQIEQTLMGLRQCHDGIAERTGISIFDVMRAQGVPEEQIKALMGQIRDALPRKMQVRAQAAAQQQEEAR